jgi:methylenetetrahydrofolate dehydrogenase (NADP+)/methenyltetrahydrofolate cyclohydrolase
MVLLEHYGISPSGKVACVIGRSAIVGKPMSFLLLQAHATVIQAHSRTPDLPKIAQKADIVVAAIGRPKMIDESYIKPGAVVIDVGINRTAEGKVVGDVDFESVSKKASAVTPVPGGVGPMTILLLMQNTLKAAELRSR